VRAWRFALLAGLLGLAGSCNCGDARLIARADLDPSSASRCVRITVQGDDGGVQHSEPLTAAPGERRSVAIYQGELSDRVTVQAFGFAAASCAPPADEAAPAQEGRFTGPVSELFFLLRGEGPCDDGQDGDGDGLMDCADPACRDAAGCGAGGDGGSDGGSDAGVPDGGSALVPFPYPPSNFTPVDVPAPDSGLLINCEAGYDTSSRTGYLCGSPVPAAKLIDAGVAGPLVLLAATGLTITDAGRWQVSGAYPLIVAIYGDATLDGPILAGAHLDDAGPGGARPGCPGTGVSGHDGGNGGGGGGGGGYGGPGAWGAVSAGIPAGGGDGGATFGTEELVPLLGGCPGGPGGVDNLSFPGNRGGAGGGAIQLSVAGALQIRSAVAAPGGGGRGCTAGSDNGGGGGGSGGAVLLEARQVVLLASARITANGGAGAAGCDGSGSSTSENGANGRIDGPYPAPGGSYTSSGGDGGAGTIEAMPGVDRTGGNFGGGGGGGGVGRIRFNALDGCSIASGPLFSPSPTSNQQGDAGCP
jgi:hypothetical protein